MVSGFGVHRVRRQRGEHGAVALERVQSLDDGVEVLARRDVVGDDDVVGHAEQAEQDGRDHARAVLAGGAVEHRAGVGGAIVVMTRAMRLAGELGEEDVAVGQADLGGALAILARAPRRRRAARGGSGRPARRAAPGPRSAARRSSAGRSTSRTRSSSRSRAMSAGVSRCSASLRKTCRQRTTPAVGGGIAAQVAEVEAALEGDEP